MRPQAPPISENRQILQYRTFWRKNQSELNWGLLRHQQDINLILSIVCTM
jgi:hypothetical protein